MNILKSTGKFSLFVLLYIVMAFIYFSALILLVWLEESSLFSWLFKFINIVGYYGTAAFFFQILRCYIINEILLSVSNRISGRTPLFVFSVLLIAYLLASLIFSSSVSNAVAILIQLVFAIILATKSRKPAKKSPPDNFENNCISTYYEG